MAYNQIIDRTGTSRTAREIPESVQAGILADVVEQSVALKMGNTFRMSALQHRIPVLKAFADAFWLNGVTDVLGGSGGGTQAEKDSAMKQTTKLEWDNVFVTPEELAVLVPIPDAWIDDSNIAWEEIERELKRAFAKKIDQAIFFGAGSVPATFGNGLVPDAKAAGNVVVVGSTNAEGTWGAGTENDIALDIAALGEMADADGYDVGGFVSYRSFNWKLRRLRDATGQPILDQIDGRYSLYGYPLELVGNGSWDKVASTILTGEWDKLVIGVKQELSMKVFDQGPIFDTTGALVYNPMQQDGKVLRAVMRLGYATPNPVKVLGGTYPFYTLSDTAI